MSVLPYLTEKFVFEFFSVERKRLYVEGAGKITTSGVEEAESEKEDKSGTTKMKLQGQLENVNNQLEFAETEKRQYADKCHYLEKQLESSEDKWKDLSKKCNDLEQQLILKEREWSWNSEKDLEKMRSELEAQLEDVKNRLQLAESENRQYADKCQDLAKELESCEEQRKDLLKKYNALDLQLGLKKRDWSWKERDFEKMRSDEEQCSNTVNALRKEIEDYKCKNEREKKEFEKEKSEIETELREANKQLERVESDKRQCSKTCMFLEKQNEELKSKLQSYEAVTNEHTNLNIPNPSPTGSREGGLEGKRHK